MTLPAWPSDVPYDAAAGWQMPQMYLLPLATDMDGGNQRVRQRPGSNVATVNYPLAPLTLTQWGALDTFIRTTLNNGALRFSSWVTIGGAYVYKMAQINSVKGSRTGDYVNAVLSLRIWVDSSPNPPSLLLLRDGMSRLIFRDGTGFLQLGH